MVIWARCIRLKLTFSHGKLIANFVKFNFVQSRRPWCLEIYRLAKFITLIQTELIQYLSRFCTYHWGIGSLKNNSAVSRSGYLYGVNQKYSLAKAFFLLIKSGTRSFMLNTMMENGNKHFANILIPSVKLFIIKLIAQINIIFFLNWRYLSYYVNCQAIFSWLASFLRFFISFLRRALNAWKKIQVQIIVFNKKAIVKISRISNSKGPLWNLVKFCSEFFLVDISKVVCRNFLVLIVNWW